MNIFDLGLRALLAGEEGLTFQRFKVALAILSESVGRSRPSVYVPELDNSQGAENPMHALAAIEFLQLFVERVKAQSLSVERANSQPEAQPAAAES